MMQFEFNGAVNAQYPKEKDRPLTNQTFMLSGIAVTWDTAPTTSEGITLKLVTSPPVSAEPLVVELNPSTDSVTSWVHKIAEGPIPLPDDMLAKVEYANTDGNMVKVVFLGYWR